jgi:hypothetical protein
MAEVLLVDGLAVSLSTADGSDLRMTSLAMPTPAPRYEWVAGSDAPDSRLVRAPFHENRVIEVRVEVKPSASIDAAWDLVGPLVDKFAKAAGTPDGIPLTYVPDGSARTVIFDLFAGEVNGVAVTGEGGGNPEAWLRYLYRSPVFDVRFHCGPYGRRSAEENVAAASSTAPVMSINVPSVGGDVPAIGRLLVTEPASQHRRHFEWGMESEATVTAPLILDSDTDLAITGYAGTAGTTTGAYDPNASGTNNIGASYAGEPVAICGTGNQPHVGSWRVRARVWASVNGTEEQVAGVYFRLTWRDGDGPYASNRWVPLPAVVTGKWMEVDLGVITVSRAVAGNQRWSGRVDVYHADGLDGTARLDYLVLIPTSAGYGKARSITPDGAETLVARDLFVGTTAGGALNARVAPTGGTWATSGATGDFLFEDLNATVEGVQRSTNVSEGTPRFALLGATNYAAIEARTQFYSQYPADSWSGYRSSVVARYVDASNYLLASVDTSTEHLLVTQVVGGAATQLASAFPGRGQLQGGRYYRIRLMVLASGLLRASWEIWTGSTHQLIAETLAVSSVLATGGALASGRIGIADQSFTSGGSAQTRHYGTVTAGVPPTEQLVIASGQTLEVRHDDVIREDTTGNAYGRPGSYRGTHLLIPPAGSDGKTARIVARAHRNDIDTVEHTPLGDNLTIRAYWTERFLVVPRA